MVQKCHSVVYLSKVLHLRQCNAHFPELPFVANCKAYFTGKKVQPDVCGRLFSGAALGICCSLLPF
jgi:hypothetical protein